MKYRNHSKTRSRRKVTKPITKKEDVEKNPDMHIDQDFPGYPHGNAKDEIIKPATKTQKKTAGVLSKKNK